MNTEFTDGTESVHPIVEQVEYGASGMSSMDCTSTGITLRQYYAGLAMQGYMAADPLAANETRTVIQTAEWSVKVADALIAALNKEEK